MDDQRPRPQSSGDSVHFLSPTRAELVRFFAWGYFSRRELNDRLRHASAAKRRGRHTPSVPTAA